VKPSDPRPGIVRLERDRRRIGLGAVLRADGRILTALSALGDGNFIQARFSDDSVASVRVVATYRPWDLALLAPEGVHWTSGLRASGLDTTADGVKLRRFRGPRLEESQLAVTGRRSLLGRDGVVLEDLLVLGGVVGEEDRGSPLFDDAGEVVGLVVSACAPPATRTCQLSPFGAPVSALKSFLREAPPREALPSAWLGFRGVAGHEGSVAGVRVISVEPGSPAAIAGLRAQGQERRPSGGAEAAAMNGDLVVAVEDVPVTTPEEMQDAINRIALAGPSPSRRTPSSAPDANKANATAGAAEGGTPNGMPGAEHQVRMLLYGSGKFREAVLPLRAPRLVPELGPASTTPSSERSAPRRQQSN
jgi:S1-C subfamily serine protease